MLLGMLRNAFGFPFPHYSLRCEDSKDTEIWDLDKLHKKLSTLEDTTCTNPAYRITGFGRWRRDAKPCEARRRVCVHRLAHNHSTDILRNFLTKLKVNDVDEDPPGTSLVSENEPNDASSLSSNEEPRNNARAPSATSLENKNDDDAVLALTWTGDGWYTVLSRTKKNHKEGKKEPEKGLYKKNEKSAGHPPVDAARDSQVKWDFQRRKRRAPTSLPKEDIKVILRPQKSLRVKNLFGSELSMAVIEACQKRFGRESFLQRVHPRSNIIILYTPHEQVAGRLREINQLKIRGPLQCEQEAGYAIVDPVATGLHHLNLITHHRPIVELGREAIPTLWGKLTPVTAADDAGLKRTPAYLLTTPTPRDQSTETNASTKPYITTTQMNSVALGQEASAQASHDTPNDTLISR
ncbi:hypothetical protein HPB51_017556 [Rhipicephalus microplus]|uniref:Uncharacterized protein n=1 Tax=Rhipicephalus microplus TaxID=6941 RepID=A0A9J6F7U9_RHIMP|nr:hypothetical protein HPB51_017556 [Rhipicephalus microplus]